MNVLARTSRQSRRRTPGGFTLIEVMASMAVMSILGLLLVSATDSALKLWLQGSSQTQQRLRSRSMLDFIGHELRTATLAKNQGAVGSSQPTLEFLISPLKVKAGCEFPQSIFWQAPIATDDHSLGDVAEIGYFVRWTPDNHANLCRYFVNPTNGTTGNANPDYLIYSKTPPDPWVSGGTTSLSGYGTAGDLDNVAPADANHNYQGLFLENVLGLWIQAYDINGNLLTGNPGSLTSYDSSANPAHPLPAYVVISIVALDNSSATKLAANNAAVSKIQNLTTTDDATTFMSDMLNPANAIPPGISSGARVASIRVSLDSSK